MAQRWLTWSDMERSGGGANEVRNGSLSDIRRGHLWALKSYRSGLQHWSDWVGYAIDNIGGNVAAAVGTI